MFILSLFFSPGLVIITFLAILYDLDFGFFHIYVLNINYKLLLFIYHFLSSFLDDFSATESVALYPSGMTLRTSLLLCIQLPAIASSTSIFRLFLLAPPKGDDDVSEETAGGGLILDSANIFVISRLSFTTRSPNNNLNSSYMVFSQ